MPEAVDMLVTELRTPLQVQLHLTLALKAGYQTGEKPVTAELVETVLPRQIGDLEPTLARHAYRLTDMTDNSTKAAEIRAMFSNQLEPKRAPEICERMLRRFICSDCESKTASNASMFDLECEPLQLDYVSRWRMQLATCPLRNNQSTISSIAQKLGYDSDSASAMPSSAS